MPPRVTTACSKPPAEASATRGRVSGCASSYKRPSLTVDHASLRAASSAPSTAPRIRSASHLIGGRQRLHGQAFAERRLQSLEPLLGRYPHTLDLEGVQGHAASLADAAVRLATSR